jgi:hypothetical protein
MADSFPKPYAASRQEPGRLTLSVVRGFDFHREVDLVTVHEDPNNPGTEVHVEIDSSLYSWSAQLKTEGGLYISDIEVTDDPDVPNRLRLFLSASVTSSLVPGSYSYVLDGIHLETRWLDPFLAAPFEVLRR